MGKNRLWGAVLSGLLIVLGLWAPASPANAATSNVEVSADPTEEKEVTLTITGDTEANRSLWVVVIPTSSSTCPGTQPFDLLTTSNRESLIRENPLVAGTYERTATFTPEDSGSYLICSYVAQGERTAASAKVGKSIQVREPAATSSVGVSSGATEEKPVTVTVTGQTEVDRNLWSVVIPTSSSSCPGNRPIDLLTASGRDVLMSEDLITAGSYQLSASFTPTESGSYLACSYVSEGPYEPSNARASKTFQVRKPNVTSSVAVSSGAAKDKPVTVTITGQTEVDRNLWSVVIPTSSSNCPGERPIDLLTATGRSRLVEDELVTAGRYQRTAMFTPTESGSYLACSYVSEDLYEPSNAKAGTKFEVRKSAALMTVVPGAAPQHLSKGSFSVQGFTEDVGRLTVYIQDDSDLCPATAAAWQLEERPPEGRLVEAGEIRTQWSFIPHTVKVHRICAYMTDSDGHTMGTATADISVERNPAFLPNLITPNKKRAFVRPPTLKWKTGPGDDYLQIFRKKPNASTRPISLKRGVVSYSGGEDVGRWTARFSLRYRYATGRYWWRVVRRDPESGYEETSSLRMFTVQPLWRRGR